MERLVVGISGASGIILAKKLMQHVPHAIDLVMTPQSLYTARYELGPEVATAKRFVAALDKSVQERVLLHGINDVGSTIASGSHLTIGMVIIPCSMATISAVAHGLGDNCLRRAADVTLKERRPLIVVPRESPLSQIHLENMLKITQLGGTVVPPMPAWYTKPQTVGEIEDFIVGKVLDVLKIEHSLYPRWKAQQQDAECAAVHR